MERVVEFAPASKWDPNGVRPTRMAVYGGVCELRLGPHPDDDDVRHVSLGSPNDEARSTHPLWHKGLSDVIWAGIVEDSELVAAINNASALMTGLTHWVILLKEETAEVVASRLEQMRV